ncbi:GIY-YIG nuclease family protein [Erwinia sp. ACCC 02193]|uniref:GIY-YIG nuclease family protein n=1 Tax=Erwinia aeris TaxID=3239803 RepID=A0ABV4E297_9GAMM
MKNFVERTSRIGRLYSEFLRTKSGEMEVLSEIEKLSEELRESGCVNAGFFDALLRQGFMFDLMAANKERATGAPHVYVLHAKDSGLTKIGFSTRVEKRVSELSNMSGARLQLIAKILANRCLETELHQKYDSFRAHGEWFSLRDDQIAELASYPGNLLVSR